MDKRHYPIKCNECKIESKPVRHSHIIRRHISLHLGWWQHKQGYLCPKCGGNLKKRQKLEEVIIPNFTTQEYQKLVKQATAKLLKRN